MTFLIAFVIWYLIGFVGLFFINTHTQDFTVLDLFFNILISFLGLIIIIFILINKYGDVVIFKKRIK
jgi:hypothetical protein